MGIGEKRFRVFRTEKCRCGAGVDPPTEPMQPSQSRELSYRVTLSARQGQQLKGSDPTR
jgi:hypothetical protein